MYHSANYKDKNVIYLLECTTCRGKAYAGKSEPPMNIRMNGHRSDDKRTDKLTVVTHFLQTGHNFERDATFTIIEKVTKKNINKEDMTNLLLRREDFLMTRLGTLQPYGLNISLNFPQ